MPSQPQHARERADTYRGLGSLLLLLSPLLASPGSHADSHRGEDSVRFHGGLVRFDSVLIPGVPIRLFLKPV